MPPIRVVCKNLSDDLGLWAPLVGLAMERETVVEQYLRNLVVGPCWSETTTVVSHRAVIEEEFLDHPDYSIQDDRCCSEPSTFRMVAS
jgi:hypothetical protein